MGSGPGQLQVCCASSAQGRAIASSPAHGDFGRDAKGSGATAQMPGSHSSSAQRDADMRSLWVFWSAPGRAAPAARSPGRCLQVPARALPAVPSPRGCSHGAARTLLRCPSPLPALPAAGALCLLSTSRRAPPAPSAAAQPRWGGAGRKQPLFLSCPISILPGQHGSAPLRVPAQRPHLCTSRHTSRTALTGGTSTHSSISRDPPAGTDILKGSFPQAFIPPDNH